MTTEASETALDVAHALRDRARQPMVYCPPSTPPSARQAYITAYHSVPTMKQQKQADMLLKQEIEQTYQKPYK